MASKTFLTQLRKRFNATQKDMAALFLTKRNEISQMECGSRALTSKQVQVLESLAVPKWRRPVAGERLAVDSGEEAKKKLLGYADDLRISIHLAKKKLQVLQRNYQADTEALVWLQIMREAVEEAPVPDKRILLWIERQVDAKRAALATNGLDKQAICVARIAGLEAELRLIRNATAKKKVVIRNVVAS